MEVAVHLEDRLALARSREAWAVEVEVHSHLVFGRSPLNVDCGDDDYDFPLDYTLILIAEMVHSFDFGAAVDMGLLLGTGPLGEEVVEVLPGRMRLADVQNFHQVLVPCLV